MSDTTAPMMRLNEFVNNVLEYNPHANVDLLKKAYNIAKEAHENATRRSGEPYFLHPLEVTKILMELRLDTPTLCASLLHDVLEDTKIRSAKIKEEFGEEVLSLVEGVTKIQEINLEGIEEQRAENIRKVLLATIKDVRVILIKLADRLHNMRTLKFMPEHKQRQIANETLEIYAPIAHKLGMFRVKSELEDLCLRYLEPDVYQDFKAKINKKREEREEEVNTIIAKINEKLVEQGVKTAKVYGRAKSFYSLYKKMKKKNLSFNEIYDLVAIRIIVDTVEECYACLGTVHNIWKPMPHKFKDYIAVPKSNDYQSLHTVVIGKKGKIIEVQIRTQQMHYHAEEGIAAHWLYKGSERDKQFDKRVSWLKQILEWMRDSGDAREFIETLKVDLFKDEIIVFTPKGTPIPLPEKSTPVDFAYEIHTEIGNHCQQARVNNKIAPLDHVLKSGDIVEIVTSPNAKPSRGWLSFVRTSMARSKIRQLLDIKELDSKAQRKKEKVESKKMETVSGMKRGSVKLGKCCNPKRGEAIRAFKMKDGKIAIHKENCINVHSMDPEREVILDWEVKKQVDIFRIFIDTEDRVGILAEILKIIADRLINIHSVRTTAKKDRVTIQFDVEVDSEKYFEETIQELRMQDYVMNLHYKKVNL